MLGAYTCRCILNCFSVCDGPSATWFSTKPFAAHHENQRWILTSENMALDHCVTVHLGRSRDHALLVLWWFAFSGSTMFGWWAHSWAACRWFITVWVVTRTPVAWKSCCHSCTAFWVWSLKALVTGRRSWHWVVEWGHPLQGKLVTFPVCWWQDCGVLNCLARFIWMLPSIPHSLLNTAWLLWKTETPSMQAYEFYGG